MSTPASSSLRNMDRPALQRLLAVVEAGALDCVVVYVVYKVDRLSR